VKKGRHSTPPLFCYLYFFLLSVRKVIVIWGFLFSLAGLWGCIQTADETDLPLGGMDLPSILRNNKLVLITESSSTGYYLYRAKPMGFDFELASAFSQYLGVKLEVKVITDLKMMFDMLERGEGDLISCNLSITEERASRVAFSSPIDETGAVLVQNTNAPSDSFVHSVSELAKIPIVVHDFSVFRTILDNAGDSLAGLDVVPALGQTDAEGLIRQVAIGQIRATVADENVARLNQNYYPNLDVSVNMSREMPIGIAMRLNDHSLHEALEEWLALPQTQKLISFLKNKYFESPREQKERVISDFSSISGKKISEYDDTIKKAAKFIDWDWRLLAALIYQESRFNPEAKSYAGAFGLMQLMPETAEKFGIDTTDKAEANILAGGKYVRFLDNFWARHIHDKNERVKFVLASYNIGPGHIIDARFIAEHLCLSQDLWHGNVETGLNLKSNKLYYELENVKNGYCRGYSATDFVDKVLATYAHFQIIDP